MCGILGFTGEHQAAPIILEGLSKLEYRGYDSAGMAVRDGEGEYQIVKAKGRLKTLAEKTDDGKAVYKQSVPPCPGVEPRQEPQAFQPEREPLPRA